MPPRHAPGLEDSGGSTPDLRVRSAKPLSLLEQEHPLDGGGAAGIEAAEIETRRQRGRVPGHLVVSRRLFLVDEHGHLLAGEVVDAYRDQRGFGQLPGDRRLRIEGIGIVGLEGMRRRHGRNRSRLGRGFRRNRSLALGGIDAELDHLHPAAVAPFRLGDLEQDIFGGHGAVETVPGHLGMLDPEGAGAGEIAGLSPGRRDQHLETHRLAVGDRIVVHAVVGLQGDIIEAIELLVAEAEERPGRARVIGTDGGGALPAGGHAIHRLAPGFAAVRRGALDQHQGVGGHRRRRSRCGRDRARRRIQDELMTGDGVIGAGIRHVQIHPVRSGKLIARGRDEFEVIGAARDREEAAEEGVVGMAAPEQADLGAAEDLPLLLTGHLQIGEDVAHGLSGGGLEGQGDDEIVGLDGVAQLAVIVAGVAGAEGVALHFGELGARRGLRRPAEAAGHRAEVGILAELGMAGSLVMPGLAGFEQPVSVIAADIGGAEIVEGSGGGAVVIHHLNIVDSGLRLRLEDAVDIIGPGHGVVEEQDRSGGGIGILAVGVLFDVDADLRPGWFLRALQGDIIEMDQGIARRKIKADIIGISGAGIVEQVRSGSVGAGAQDIGIGLAGGIQGSSLRQAAGAEGIAGRGRNGHGIDAGRAVGDEFIISRAAVMKDDDLARARDLDQAAGEDLAGGLAIEIAHGVVVFGDLDQIILDLAVDGQPDRGQSAGPAEAEAGVDRCEGGGRAGHGELEQVRSGMEGLADEELLARVIPVAVAVPVEPGVELAGHGGGHLDDRGFADGQFGEELNAVLIAAVGGIIARGGNIRVAVAVGIDPRAEVKAGDDLMAGAVAGEQGAEGIGGIAEIIGRSGRRRRRRVAGIVGGHIGGRARSLRAAVFDLDVRLDGVGAGCQWKRGFKTLNVVRIAVKTHAHPGEIGGHAVVVGGARNDRGIAEIGRLDPAERGIEQAGIAGPGQDQDEHGLCRAVVAQIEVGLILFGGLPGAVHLGHPVGGKVPIRDLAVDHGRCGRENRSGSGPNQQRQQYGQRSWSENGE